MIHNLTGLIHTLAAVLALFSGFIFFRPKGGRFHRTLGYVYVGSMATTVVTSLLIFRLTRSFNILHFAAFVSGIGVGLGLFAAVTRRPAMAGSRDTTVGCAGLTWVCSRP